MSRRLVKTSSTLSPTLSGAMLMADFMSAITNLSTAATAQYVAEQSEQNTLQTINAAAPGNNIYVTPNDLTSDQQAELVRASLNAHLQKAQSEQIAQFTQQQLEEMEVADSRSYKGKKVRIQVLDPKFQPVESVWQDKQTGRVRQGTIKAKSIKGIIENISFQKNLIVLKPTLGSRLILPDRKFLCVYPINPETLEPAVEITLL